MRSTKMDNAGFEDRRILLLLRGLGELFGSSSIYPGLKDHPPLWGKIVFFD